MPTILGTAAYANIVLALAAIAPPTTVSPLLPTHEERPARATHKNTSRLSPEAAKPQLTTMLTVEVNYEESARPTTSPENIIGEIRQWTLLGADWDGEGAATPMAQSLKEAVSFVRLLDDTHALPEPMLLASGHAALNWNEGGLYADLEFLGDGRIAYFIKKYENKHKGVLTFDSQKMPAVFPPLIWA